MQRVGVERCDGYRIALGPCAQFERAEIAFARVVEKGDDNCSCVRAERFVLGRDVAAVVERGIAAEHLMQNGLGLEGEHAAARAHGLREAHGVRADVGADIDRDHAGTEILTEQFDLGLGELAVEIERAADMRVAREEHHRPVLAVLEAEDAVVEQGAEHLVLCGHRLRRSG